MRERISKVGKMLLGCLLMCLVISLNAKASTGSTETESNNTFATANEMMVNTEYTANLSARTDIDYYKIVLTESGSLYAKLKTLEDSYDNNWTVTLYKEDSDLNISKMETWNAGSKKNTAFTKYRLPAGTYYLKVTSCVYDYIEYYSGADYMLTVNFTAESANTYEIEENDTMETANVIQVNQEYIGNIHSKSDKDYYKFVLNENSHIQLKFTQPSELGDGVYCISLYRIATTGEKVLYDRRMTTNNITNYGNSSDIPAGTYMLLVEYGKQLKDKNDYKINIVQTTVTGSVIEADIPDTIYGSIIAVNNEMELGVGTYTFHLPEQGKLIFNGNGNEEQDAYTLYRIDEMGNEDYARSSNFLDTIRVGKGDYVIKVRTSWGGSEYLENIKINYVAESPYNTETENNDNFATANAIELKREYTGNVEGSRDEDYYKVTIPTRGVLSVNFSNTLESGSKKWTITLYKEESNGNRTEIGNQSVGQSKNSEVGRQRLDAGTYYIKVSGYQALYDDDIEYVASDYHFTVSYQECVNFEEAEISSVDSQTYTGSELTPDVVVNYKGRQLTNGIDYTLSYSNNVNAGTATIQITGEDIYEGVKTVNFVINKATQIITSADVYDHAYSEGWLALNAMNSGLGILSYSSDNPIIADVSPEGYVIPKVAGSVKITITANATENYEEAKKTVTVNIYKMQQWVEIQESVVEKSTVDTSFSLNAYTTGDGALVYVSLNPAVATVNGDGLVTLTGMEGSAIIAIIAAEGEQYAPSAPVVVTLHVAKPIAEIGKTYIDDSNTAWYKVTSETTVTYVIEDKYKEVVTIPDTITIYGDTFKVTRIANKSFYKDDVIEKVKLGKNITSIGKNAFDGCVYLKSITLNKNLKTIESKAFNKCTSLTKITIPDKVTKIGNNAFANCSKLSKVIIGKSVTKIGKSAFYGDKKLKTITIKSYKISTVGKKAFYKINTKAKITVPTKKLSAYKKKIESSGISASVIIKK